jgi:hypothetical protein
MLWIFSPEIVQKFALLLPVQGTEEQGKQKYQLTRHFMWK